MERLIILIVLLLVSLPHAASREKVPEGKKTVPIHEGFVKVLVVGDSISAGFGIDKSLGWVSLLDQELGEAVSFVNASISGDTSTGGRHRIEKALQVHEPNIVIIELGGNDGLRGTPIRLIEKNLEQMARLSQGSGAKVLFLGMQIPPNYGARYTELFKAMYPKVAKATDSVLVPFLLEGVAGVEGMMQEDGIHPTTPAQRIMSGHVKPVLASIIESLLAK